MPHPPGPRSPGTPALAPRGALARPHDVEDFALTLIASRQSTSPRRLIEPGPNPEQLRTMLSAAAAAPDHAKLTPWRFVVIPGDKRHRLAEAFAQALADRDPSATQEQFEAARAKAYRAPLLMLAIACLGPREPDTPPLERMLSLGAAIQNVLLCAHAMGFGAGLTSGQAMTSPRLHALFGLGEGESPVCCVNIGTAAHRTPWSRVRPAPAEFVSELPSAPA